MSRRTVLQVSVGLVIVIGLGLGLLSFSCSHKADLTLTFSREDLQNRVSKDFPFDQKLLLADVTYSEPLVDLQEGSDRIGLTFTATVKLAGSQLVKGRLGGDWSLRYDSAESSLFVDDPRIKQLSVQGIPTEAQDLITKIGEPVLEDYLRRVPVYRLNKNDVRQDLARSVLKSVSVKNGKLLVVVGPPSR